jgi:hypothetical protein
MLWQFPHSPSSTGQWWSQRGHCHTSTGNASPQTAQMYSMHVTISLESQFSIVADRCSRSGRPSRTCPS